MDDEQREWVFDASLGTPKEQAERKRQVELIEYQAKLTAKLNAQHNPTIVRTLRKIFTGR